MYTLYQILIDDLKLEGKLTAQDFVREREEVG